ncbi:unnamed protein product [Parnassius apollo]|uniref:(apollo) hypothetical protein n=1 Tax=Parnassius apollo TaxID=110799 RepID=A0A8S3W4P1_PARAO|nr:unnamed protein product [Parnassius apollo]
MAHRMSDNAIASALVEESDDELDELFLPGSEDESDHLSVQSECESEEEEITSGGEFSSSRQFCMGKDCKTKWLKEPQRTNIRTRNENIITHLPGVKSQYKDKKTHLECFEAFISNEILEYYLLIFLLMSISVNGQNNADGSRRQRRYLLFTPNTQWGVFVTVSIPLHPETTVSVAWFFEANYYNVANATYFEPLLGDTMIPTKRNQRSVDSFSQVLTRKRLYVFIESLLEKHGYSGRACLLRAICEGTTSHFWHNGVLGDVLHLILTPSTSISEIDVEDCYYEAEYNGLEEQCEYYFNECPDSPLELISMYL